MPETNTDFMNDLDALAEEFKKKVIIKDRKYHLQTYKQCFVGHEAVDYLVESGSAPSRQDAVELGRALQHTNLFEHVCREHEFSDEYLFFRILEGTERGSLKVDETTGETVEWSNFLAPASSGDPNHEPWQPKISTVDLEALNSNDVHVASKMWPMDSYNTTLLNHVHPPEWQDPDPGFSKYDLVVIGGGTGGLISASGSAGVGAKVAMIEEHMLGGDWYVPMQLVVICVHTGVIFNILIRFLF
jgi:hypothetical protein